MIAAERGVEQLPLTEPHPAPIFDTGPHPRPLQAWSAEDGSETQQPDIDDLVAVDDLDAVPDDAESGSLDRAADLGADDVDDLAEAAETIVITTDSGPQPVTARPSTVPGQFTFVKRWKYCLLTLGIWAVAAAIGVGLFFWWYHSMDKAPVELGVLVFLHPLGFTHAGRMSEYYFNNLIGNPLESTLAVGHLIFGGVLDAYPGLKICVAHGGGYLPGYWGRMDHGWRARGDCSEHCQHEPSSYLRKLWFDTLVFDKDQLDSLIRTHGADRLCLGSDYPFDMSEPDPVGFHGRLDDETKARILGLNAAALLGLERAAPPSPCPSCGPGARRQKLS